MAFRKKVEDANPEFGTLKLIDKVGTLTAQVYANGKTSTKTLEIKMEEFNEETDWDTYAKKAREVQEELYKKCSNIAPSIDVSDLEVAMAKYCDPKLLSKVKAQIQTGIAEETKQLLAGF